MHFYEDPWICSACQYPNAQIRLKCRRCACVQSKYKLCYSCKDKYTEVPYCPHKHRCEACVGKIVSCSDCLRIRRDIATKRSRILEEFLPAVLVNICLEYIPTQFRLIYHVHEFDHDGYCSDPGDPTEAERDVEERVLIPKEFESRDFVADAFLGLKHTDFVRMRSSVYKICGGSGYCGYDSKIEIIGIKLV